MPRELLLGRELNDEIGGVGMVMGIGADFSEKDEVDVEFEPDRDDDVE